MLGEALDRFDIGLLSPGYQAAELHVLDHSTSEFRHRTSPSFHVQRLLPQRKRTKRR
jgi:hypothetical protein